MSINNRVLVLDDDQQLLTTYQTILGPQPKSSDASRLAAFLDEGEGGETAEDEEVMEGTLDIPHFELDLAAQGERGIALVEQSLYENRPYAVAFIDIRMPPGIDGLQAAQRIRELDNNIYIIIVTAYSDRSVEEIQRHVRHDVVLARKPMTREEIFQQARNACMSWEKDRELERKSHHLEQLNLELKEKVDIFNKFVPKKFIRVMEQQEDAGHIDLGECHERIMTVMFSDIRSFTALSESITPTDSFRFINSYLGHMGPIIRKHDGFIDKYMGDGIMALFEQPENAVRTAIEMSHRLFEYNVGRKRAGYIPIAIGVGINVGPLMLGTIGESDRMDTTVIGDTVNLAARTEGLTKTYGTPILLTEQALASLPEQAPFELRLIDYVQVKGKSQPMAFHEVLDAHPDAAREQKMAIVSRYREGVQYYHDRQIEEATRCFQACLMHCPDDVPTRIFLQRCWGMAAQYTQTIDPDSDG
uniref:Adenylate/guanylate cyclase n=1 Tax=Magnetococcus massalia (strain MO-1) TaxID=451514 RepID=A0A1S7LQF3_MAGMO|nr:Conserved protein of unknown function. Containing adenylate/guanylate cyclase domain [Candidatus Magnetococcus massalia]